MKLFIVSVATGFVIATIITVFVLGNQMKRLDAVLIAAIFVLWVALYFMPAVPR